MCIYIYDFVFVFHAPSRCAHDLNTTTTTPGENFVQVAWIFFKLKCEAKKKKIISICVSGQNNKFVECSFPQQI